MKTILEILNLSANFLKGKRISNPRRQAEELLADALNISRLELYLEFERPLTESELEDCRKFLARRAAGEPLPYIKGEVHFFDCKFTVSPSVLIPRQETEILVGKIAQELKKLETKDKTLWDVCCGSGCIGISLKKKFPELRVCLADISPEALAVARANALKNKVEVEFFEGNLLTPFSSQKCDYFVCNPPYVSQAEFEDLEQEVKAFEPYKALVAGATGLEFYERLSSELLRVLNPSGRGWLEIGKGQGEAVLKMFLAKPWVNCRYEQDWSGHDRFFFLEIE